MVNLNLFHLNNLKLEVLHLVGSRFMKPCVLFFFRLQVTTLGEAPSKRTDHSVVLFRDSLLVFGGFDGHNRLGLGSVRLWQSL